MQGLGLHSEGLHLLDVLFVAILEVLRMKKLQDTEKIIKYAYLHLIHRDTGLSPESHVGIQSLPDVLNMKGTPEIFYRKMQYHIPGARLITNTAEFLEIKLRKNALIAFMIKVISV